MNLITRKDTIEYLMTNMNWHDEDGYAVEDADEKRAIITDLINGIPDADDGWIPVEKRLPEYGVLVLTYNTDDYCLNHIIDEETGEWFRDGASAWMPLPKPYKPKEDS